MAPLPGSRSLRPLGSSPSSRILSLFPDSGSSSSSLLTGIGFGIGLPSMRAFVFAHRAIDLLRRHHLHRVRVSGSRLIRSLILRFFLIRLRFLILRLRLRSLTGSLLPSGSFFSAQP